MPAMRRTPHRVTLAIAWALVALPAVPGLLAAFACGECAACPMETRSRDAGCQPEPVPRLVADCCASLAAPPAPATQRAPAAATAATTLLAASALHGVQGPRQAEAARQPAVTPPVDLVPGVRLHTLYSVFLI